MVVPLPVAAYEPAGKLAAWKEANRGIVAVFTDDGLIEVEQHQIARLLWRCVVQA